MRKKLDGFQVCGDRCFNGAGNPGRNSSMYIFIGCSMAQDGRFSQMASGACENYSVPNSVIWSHNVAQAESERAAAMANCGKIIHSSAQALPERSCS